MPIEISQLTIRAAVRDQMREVACGPEDENREENRRRGQANVSQRSAGRLAAETTAEMLKRQKER
jgi:hypothetical protein